MISKKNLKNKRSLRIRSKLKRITNLRLCAFRSSKHIYIQVIDDKKERKCKTQLKEKKVFCLLIERVCQGFAWYWGANPKDCCQYLPLGDECLATKPRIIFPISRPFIRFIIFPICLYCFTNRFKSWIVVPEPRVIRRFRDPFKISGLRRSAGVIESIITSMRAN